VSLLPASLSGPGRAERDRGLGTTRSHLDPAALDPLAEGDVGALLEAERLGVELDHPVLVRDRNDDVGNLADPGARWLCLCSSVLLGLEVRSPTKTGGGDRAHRSRCRFVLRSSRSPRCRGCEARRIPRLPTTQLSGRRHVEEVTRLHHHLAGRRPSSPTAWPRRTSPTCSTWQGQPLP
jgi:hypothetical protein